MGRNLKQTVEYYPHFIGDGKKMFTIQHKYGNNGYAAWNKLLELLAKTKNHWLDVSKKSELMFISSYCLISEELLMDIIEDLVQLDEFDNELWKHNIIWSEKFITSIQFAYAKRANPCITRDQLIKELILSGRLETPRPAKQIPSSPAGKTNKKKTESIADVNGNSTWKSKDVDHGLLVDVNNMSHLQPAQPITVTNDMIIKSMEAIPPATFDHGIDDNKIEVKTPQGSTETLTIKKFDFKIALEAAGGKPEYVREWLIIRKKKRGQNSELAFRGFMREVGLSGLSIDEVLVKCIEKSWGTFESAWIPSQNQKTSSKQTHNNSGDSTDWNQEIKDAHGK